MIRESRKFDDRRDANPQLRIARWAFLRSNIEGRYSDERSGVRKFWTTLETICGPQREKTLPSFLIHSSGDPLDCDELPVHFPEEDGRYRS